ncbi:SusC/RagA family TonB-linked outer membrane protein [Aquimarina intermedia]|uniref:TonB-linked SusC/RagA family outer membrane protein n=1 Tax=Aquimarina intermedia TaxID=350814 RepID=A0A5S5C0A4_9FLAO|nr:SusC/RagA family TonB-linked outer membrane protein [Aquimarina intermedia]TYP72861.1 TonB-linked SusC/RagA family outer membrane protein [Aquimarina intermedia]
MKTRTTKILMLFFALVVQLSFAQEKSISGKVTDGGGMPLPGVNIIIKDSNSGTQTDFDGLYTIQASTGSTLVFSYLGFTNKEITVGGDDTVNVVLEESAAQLDEVVVTALGISREKKSLGYSTQEVGGEEVNQVKTANFVNSLSGKASGVQIRKNTNMGGSTNVVIRGNSSLTGNNQALFVIDGVPINNNNSNSRAQEQAGTGYDYGNAASDINPDDIESVNILKGAAASALYGSRAANGVVIITTKRGTKGDGYGVTVNSGVTFGTVDESTFVKYQDQYGAGYGPYYSSSDGFFNTEDIDNDGNLDLVVPFTEDASYGGRFDPNLLVYQWDAFYPESPNYLKATPYVNAANGPIEFFETPFTLTNSVSLDRATDKGSFRLGYTNFDQKGLLPNSELRKNNFSLNADYKLTEKLTARGFANYIKTDAVGRNSTGYNDNIMGMFRQWWQTNVDLKQQRDAYFATGRNVTWNRKSTTNPAPIYWDNPYWTRYENYQSDERNRFIGIASLNYKVADWFDVLGRVSVDTYNELQEERRAIGSVPSAFGLGTSGADRSGGRIATESGYSRKDIVTTEYNYDLIANFNKDITEKLNLSGLVGLNVRRSSYKSVFASTNGGLAVPNIYALQNTKSPLLYPFERDEKIGVDGIYASASIGYDDTYYLDATIRRDKSSTLPADNSTFYYPSVSGSFIFSKLLEVDAISFGKFRLNYAEVGNSPGFDRVLDTYAINTAFGGASASVKNTKNNPDLKPETTTSIEAGLEMSFLTGRVGFDFSYYKNNTKDQIIPLSISTATGYSYRLINAGEIENKGVEVSLFGKVIDNPDFGWEINANWSKNENAVISLFTDANGNEITNYQLGSFQGGVSVNATVGQPFGTIQGTDYTYINGERVVNASSGEYIKTGTSDNVIGNITPDWNGGINNKFRYKNIGFSFLIDIQKGGDIFSLDQYYGRATGLYEETAFTNDLGNPVRNSLADGGGFINPGVNPDGSTNTTRIRADRFGAFGYRRGLPNAAFVYDASYVKLREVVLSYNFPKKLLDKTFLNTATFSFIGSNLWIIDKNLPHADPESGLGAGNLQGYSTGSLPSTRDFAFNVKLQF